MSLIPNFKLPAWVDATITILTFSAIKLILLDPATYAVSEYASLTKGSILITYAPVVLDAFLNAFIVALFCFAYFKESLVVNAKIVAF